MPWMRSGGRRVPLEPSPRGVVAPAALRRDLQRAVYSAATSAAKRIKRCRQSLHALEASIAAERIEVSRALELADVENPISAGTSLRDAEGDEGARKNGGERHRWQR